MSSISVIKSNDLKKFTKDAHTAIVNVTPKASNKEIKTIKENCPWIMSITFFELKEHIPFYKQTKYLVDCKVSIFFTNQE